MRALFARLSPTNINKLSNENHFTVDQDPTIGSDHGASTQEQSQSVLSRAIA